MDTEENQNATMALMQSDVIIDESVEVLGVQEMLKKLKITKVPDYFFKPLSLRPQSRSSAEVAPVKEDNIPLVDLSSSREELLKTIGQACKWGFFQVINHGIPMKLQQKVASEAEEFFALPVEEKIRCTTPAKVAGPVHFGGGNRGDWRDVLKLQCAPESAVKMEYWPRQPPSFREILMTYSTEAQTLPLRLLGLVSESLGLEKGYIHEVCKNPGVLMVINHYLPCPDPSLTIGIREHSDPNTITILLQDEAGGFQVCKEGAWIDVQPIENALVVNVGDHLKILSSGKLSSCLHRVVSNKFKSRTSIATFFLPSLTFRVGPAPDLVDDQHPAIYSDFSYADFLEDFYGRGGPNNRVTLSQFELTKD